MKLFDKILLVFFSVLLMVLCLGVLLLAIGWPLTSVGFAILLWTHCNWVLAIVGIVFFAFAMRMVFAVGAEKRAKPNSALVRRSDIGGSFITVSALNGMVLRHCRADRRVRDCKVSVEVAGDSLRILVRISATPDTVLPELIADLQRSVKEYVEQMSGITVTDVTIRIESTDAPAVAAPRVG